MNFSSVKDLIFSVGKVCDISQKGLSLKDAEKLRTDFIDILVYNSVFNKNVSIQKACQWIIWECAQKLEVKPSSIQELYEERGHGEYKGFTVPAINIRGLTYDVARAIIRAALKNKVGAFIFEIARSEMGYTYQRPAEYTTVILAAAIKEGFIGPIFVQGDHFQLSTRKFKEDSKKELEAIKDLIEEAIKGGFYNIDIDSSTLVDLEKSSVPLQQKDNYEVASEITAFIRKLQPKGLDVSVGAEIGEVGGKNSTPEELRGFMDGYLKSLKEKNPKLKGISKISIQTGTSHGGVVLADGSVAEVKLDFDILKNLSLISQKDYGLGGAVQHGASTLPSDAFHRFPETETLEVHLATEFQNMIYEHPLFPKELRDEIYQYLNKEYINEKKSGQTEEQFVYKTRKKGFGPFKEKFWNMPEEIRKAIGETLEEKFDFLFNKLNVINTKDTVQKTITSIDISKPLPEALNAALEGREPVAEECISKSMPEADYHPDEIGE